MNVLLILATHYGWKHSYPMGKFSRGQLTLRLSGHHLWLSTVHIYEVISKCQF